jgi:hypothetical protein
VEQHPGSVEFADSIRADIEERTEQSDGRKTVVFRKLRTVLRESGGWVRRGSENVGLIVDALNAGQVYWNCDLAEIDIDDYVCFSLHPIQQRTPVAMFGSERGLMAHIEANYRVLFDQVEALTGLEMVASEVEYQRTPSSQRADMLFTDSKGKRIVIELEVGDPQESSAFQILKYMNASNARLGVLITARPSRRTLEMNMREALELMKPEKPNIWLVYTVSSQTGKLALKLFN